MPKYQVKTHETVTITFECAYEVEADDLPGMLREIDKVKGRNPVKAIDKQLAVKIIEFHRVTE